MKNPVFAFISRHAPTQGQLALAASKGIDLISIGDMDAFHVQPSDVANKGDFDGVVVVHPAMALRLIEDYSVGVFENANRAPEGERPTFEAVGLHLFYRKRPMWDIPAHCANCGI